jgi:hypothetical protein
MDLIIGALDGSTTFSAVSLGVTESFVLAQYNILAEDEFMGHKEAWVAAQGLKRGFDHRGIRFPNTEARDEGVRALKQADAIGYNIEMDGRFAETVLDYYGIRPKYIFEANIRRVIMFSQQEKFERMLAGRKIVLICSYAEDVKAAMERELQSKLGFTVTGTVKLEEYEDIPRVKAELQESDFDFALLAAGINALILAPYISQTLGKVAFDFGQAMESFVTGEIEMKGYLEKYIGLEKLMKM